MPKDHSASPLSCGLLKAGKVFVSSFVQTYKGSWRDMVHLPSIPKAVHRQDGETAPSCQVLSAQALTRILGKNPIPERGPPPQVMEFFKSKLPDSVVKQISDLLPTPQET